MLIGCPYCAHTRATLFRANQPLQQDHSVVRNIMKCHECGLLYPEQRLGIQKTREYIAQYKFEGDASTVTNKDPREAGYHPDVISNQIQFFRMVLSNIEMTGRSLDIGTWTGRDTYVCGQMGFDSYGLEPDGAAAAFARSQGLQVFTGMFPYDVPHELSSQKYSLVISNGSICYFHDLRDSLAKVRRMLSPEGVLLIQCPHGSSSYYEERFGNSFYSRYLDAVQGIPTPEAMESICRKSGFQLDTFWNMSRTGHVPVSTAESDSIVALWKMLPSGSLY